METIPQPDRLIHEPARLAILTVLIGCDSADFVFLSSVTGLSKGNLSVQLGKLESAGLIRTRRELEGKKTRTTVEITPPGTSALAGYWNVMDKLRPNGTGRRPRSKRKDR